MNRKLLENKKRIIYEIFERPWQKNNIPNKVMFWLPTTNSLIWEQNVSV